MTRSLHIFIYDISETFRTAFEKLLLQIPKENGSWLLTSPSHNTKIKVSVVHSGFVLDSAVPKYKINTIVSPGNSFGWLEGGFDLAISKYYANAINNGIKTNLNRHESRQLDPSYSYRSISYALHSVLLSSNNFSLGYNPPQSALYIPSSQLLENVTYPEKLTTSLIDSIKDTTASLVHLPTMAYPQKLTPESRLNQSVVFNCTWNLMQVLMSQLYNVESSEEEEHDSRSESTGVTLNVLLSGLGTGVGNIKPQVAALHMFKAISIYSKVFSKTYNSDGTAEIKENAHLENSALIEELMNETSTSFTV